MSTQPRFIPKVVSCRSCGKMIIFLAGNAGQSIPCETRGVDAGETKFDSSRHIKHVDNNKAKR